MKVICISGKARHGKDTLAGVLKKHLEDHGNRVLVTHFGDLVKYICEKFLIGMDRKMKRAEHFFSMLVQMLYEHRSLTSGQISSRRF